MFSLGQLSVFRRLNMQRLKLWVMIVVIFVCCIPFLSALEYGITYSASTTPAGENRSELGIFFGISIGRWGMAGSLSVGESPYAEYSDAGLATLGFDYYLAPTISLSMDLTKSTPLVSYLYVLVGGEYALTGSDTIPLASQRPAYADFGVGEKLVLRDKVLLRIQLSTSIASYVSDFGFVGFWEYPYFKLSFRIGL
jgi:hypothetical protein